MNAKYVKKVVSILLSVAMGSLSGCKSSESGGGGGGGGATAAAVGSNVASVTQSYAGAGSDWTFNFLSDGVFEAHERTANVDIKGNYTKLEAGFLKLKIISATGLDAPSVGEEAYALEIPGVALLVKPLLSFEEEIITLVATGKCPTSDYTGNWIFTQFPEMYDLSSVNQEAFGMFQWHQNESFADLPGKYAVENFTSLQPNLTPMNGQCENGILTIDDGIEKVKMYLTQVGAALVKLPSGEGVLTLPSVSIENQQLLGGSYSGLVFSDRSLNISERVLVVQADIDVNGQELLGYNLTQIEPPVRDKDPAVKISIDAINAPGAGFIKATVTSLASLNTAKMACMTVINIMNTGKNVFFCVGQEPDDHRIAYNVLLVSK